MKKYGQKRKKQYWLILFGTILVCLWLFAVFYDFCTRSFEYAQKESKTQLTEAAQQMAGSIKMKMNDSIEFVENAAVVFSQFQQLHSTQAIELLEKMTEQSSFDMMRLTTPDGNSYASKNNEINIAQRNHFKAAMRGKSGISNTVVSLYNGETIFVVYAPVYRGNTIIGEVHGTSESGSLLKNVIMPSFGQKSYAYVFEQNGSILLDADKNSVLYKNKTLWDYMAQKEFSRSSAALMRKNMEEGKSGFISYWEDDGEERLGYYMPIGVNDWYLLEVIPMSVETTVSAPIQNLAFILVAKIVFICILLAGTILQYERKTTRAVMESREMIAISNKRFQIAMNHMASIVFEFDCKKGSIEFFGEKQLIPDMERYLLHGPQDFIDYGLIYELSMNDFKNSFELIKKGEKTAVCIVKMWEPKKDYSWQKIMLTNLFGENGQPLKAIGTIEDVTELKEAELRYTSEEQYRLAMLSDAVAIYEVNVSMNQYQIIYSILEQETQIREWNPYTYGLREYMREHVYKEDLEHFWQFFDMEQIKTAFEEGKTDLEMECRLVKKNGSLFWASANIHLLKELLTGNIMAYIYVRDIDERKKEELVLRYKAECDQLTGLYNREKAEKAITTLLKKGEKEKIQAFLSIDLDGFKAVNDSYGHAAGDEVLKKAAAEIRKTAQKGDIAARMGGDEFVLFLTAIELESIVLAKACGLCKQISMIEVQGIKGKISASIGIAIAPWHGMKFKELYLKSDVALYRAKSQGRNRFVVYRRAMGIMSDYEEKE